MDRPDWAAIQPTGVRLHATNGRQALQTSAAWREETMATEHASNRPIVGTPTLRPQRQRVKTIDLMQGAREVIIVHEEEEYILRITKSGKLILTK
jgi:hemin uptake protein HemP